MKRSIIILLSLAILVAVGADIQANEHRSLWINSWGTGFGTPTDTTTMVNWARSANLNCIIPEVRLRADAYYYSTIEPPGTGTAMQPGYDPLADMVTKAHAQNMEVHPWVVTYRIWTTTTGPSSSLSPTHVWYTHPEWRMKDDTGSYFAGGTSNLDPGHPEVEDYLITVFMDIITRYDVDGFALDYIRYPGTSWGYNDVTVARFNQEYGRTGSPGASDPDWMEFRRDQISNLVKRLYLETKAVKPHVKIGAAVWNSASTGKNTYLQDWEKWMQNKWMDYVQPMIYTGNLTILQNYLNQAYPMQYGHHIYPVIDAAQSNIIDQIGAVRTKGFPGVGLYCWQTISRSWLQSQLVSGPFPTQVPPADMPWLSSPTKGYLKGFIKNTGGTAIYPAYVTILGPNLQTKDSGTGFYGYSEVTPGTYTVRVTATGFLTQDQPVTITAGNVAHLDFTMQPEGDPPVISNVRVSNLQATNVTVLWDTDKPATSRVEYGLTTSYGTTTPEQLGLVTSHSVLLMNLQPNTTYHYRVRSVDGGGNVSQSGDYAFTTTSYDSPADIIIDNTDSGTTVVGSWLTSSSAVDKYGSNYMYCSGYTGGKTFTWTPTIVTAGKYDVYAWWSQGDNRSAVAPYFVQWSGGSATTTVNQKINGGKWNKIAEAKQFVAGTAGYVRLSNAGVETDKNVIADAVKFVFVGDLIPPTAPTNLVATVLDQSTIDLSWGASTDNVGVAAYRIFRNDMAIAETLNLTYSKTGHVANMPYSYYIKARDAENNYSDPSNTVVKYTLSVPPGASSVTCDKPVDTWQTSPTFAFTAVGGFGTAVVEYYRTAWTQTSTYNWTDAEPQWASGTLEETCGAGGEWYLHVKGYNAEDVENGTYTYGPYKYEATPPQMGAVDDGGAYIDKTQQISASWPAATDPESGVVEYQYAVGTSPANLGSVIGWTSAGMNTSVTTTGLTLTSGITYYIGVKALNGAGQWSDTAASDGITAADVVPTIAEVKALQDGAAVRLAGKLASAGFGDHFYFCEGKLDQISGIRANASAPGDGCLVTVSGILQTVNGERVLTAAEVEDSTGPGAPNALFMINRSVGGSLMNAYTPGVKGAVGLNNIGLLISVAGKVKSTGTGFAIVDDGSGEVKVDTSTLVLKTLANSQWVRITGISATEQSGSDILSLLKPRGDDDVVIQ